MLSFLLILLLFSNALASRRDKSIMFSRIVIMSFFFASFLAYNNLHIKALETGICIFRRLFSITTITHSFNIFILLVSWFLYMNTRKTYLAINLAIFLLSLTYIPLLTKFLSKQIVLSAVLHNDTSATRKVNLTFKDVTISGSLSFTISAITLLLLLFIYIPQEWFDIVSIISLVLFNN